ncbi:MAG TPA: SIMPL domain-containing protein [Saprospiraceae bacterium]|nr:SIMPL domain-containing protein [Saprospiraceae bacterium]
MFLPVTFLYSQQSGNSAYGQNYSYGKQAATGNLYLSDSTFLIEANVMSNTKADEYVVTFGLDEEASTLKECNEKMEKRIQSFAADLVRMGIPVRDIYVDMTTQNKIYDYKVTGQMAEQYVKGFELKKNVITKFKNIKDLDEMIIAASNHQIYDLVKVDYIVTNLNEVYTQLFKSAMEVINQKKDLYSMATGSKLLPMSQIYGEQFYSYYPSQLYKNYTAYSSSEVYTDASTVKEARKSPVFYYDKIDYSGFDKIIEPSVTEPAVEFVLTLQVRYEMEK